MHQPHNDFLAGVGGDGEWWVRSDSGRAEPFSGGTFVRGHELHMLALLPRSRLVDPRLLRATRFDSIPVFAVAFSGDSVIMYLSRADTLPVGLRLSWPDPEIVMSWSGWIEQEGVELFRDATIMQGTEAWHYRYDGLDLRPLPDSVFEPPASR